LEFGKVSANFKTFKSNHEIYDDGKWNDLKWLNLDEPIKLQPSDGKHNPCLEREILDLRFDLYLNSSTACPDPSLCNALKKDIELFHSNLKSSWCVDAEEIFKAVRKGRLKDHLAMLDEKPDLVNATDESGCSLLQACIVSDEAQEADCKILIERGADVNHACRLGYPPLFEAIYRNKKGLINLLLSKGAEVNNPVDPALNLAVRKNDFDIIKVLVDHGADVNHEYTYRTPLMDALDREEIDIKIIIFLLDSGANPSFKSKRTGYTPLSLLKQRHPERSDVINLLIEHGAKE
jgi:ankyrin repeat protein